MDESLEPGCRVRARDGSAAASPCARLVFLSYQDLTARKAILECAGLNSPRLETPLPKNYSKLHMSTGTPSGVEDEELIVTLAAMVQLLP